MLANGAIHRHGDEGGMSCRKNVGNYLNSDHSVCQFLVHRTRARALECEWIMEVLCSMAEETE